jgi:hypothetical protein
MDRIARVRHEHDIARRRDRLRHVGEALFRTECRDDLRFRIEAHAEPALVVIGLSLAETGNALRRRVAVGTRLGGVLAQLCGDVLRRRQVGIAHAEIDDVRSVLARECLHLVHGLEHVRRQTADGVELLGHRQ